MGMGIIMITEIMMMLRERGRTQKVAVEPKPKLPPANGQDRYNFRAPFGFSDTKSQRTVTMPSHRYKDTQIHMATYIRMYIAIWLCGGHKAGD